MKLKLDTLLFATTRVVHCQCVSREYPAFVLRKCMILNMILQISRWLVGGATATSSKMFANSSTFIVLVGFLSFSHLLEAKKGLDVSVMLHDFDFKDFDEGGNGDFVIFQGYRSNGSVNPNALGDSEEASAAGYDNVDVYMSPCVRCNKSASQQVQQMGKS